MNIILHAEDLTEKEPEIHKSMNMTLSNPRKAKFSTPVWCYILDASQKTYSQVNLYQSLRKKVTIQLTEGVTHAQKHETDSAVFTLLLRKFWMNPEAAPGSDSIVHQDIVDRLR